MQKILYILRHGKAEKDGASDEARPLSARGVEESRAIGRYFAAQKLAFGRVICSPSVRTRQTLEHVKIPPFTLPPQAGGVKIKPPPFTGEARWGNVDYDPKLYLASANDILKLLSAADESAPSLLLIGHNPGLHELAVKLAGSGDKVLLNHMAAEFPPCAFAAIDLGEIMWREAAMVKGKLLTFVTPKMLR